MHMPRTCHYCPITFTPRAQTSNPKACPKDECQCARQRDNEQAWRERHKVHYKNDYYEHQRIVRDKIIQEIVEEIVKCLESGKNFLAEKVKIKNLNLIEFKKQLVSFFSQLGIRRIKQVLKLQLV